MSRGLYGGSTQEESPEWIPASSMCCMMPADHDALAVAQRIDVDLERVLEKAVEKDRMLGRGLDGARAWSRPAAPRRA